MAKTESAMKLYVSIVGNTLKLNDGNTIKTNKTNESKDGMDRRILVDFFIFIVSINL